MNRRSFLRKFALAGAAVAGGITAAVPAAPFWTTRGSGQWQDLGGGRWRSPKGQIFYALNMESFHYDGHTFYPMSVEEMNSFSSPTTYYRRDI